MHDPLPGEGQRVLFPDAPEEPRDGPIERKGVVDTTVAVAGRTDDEA